MRRSSRCRSSCARGSAPEVGDRCGALLRVGRFSIMAAPDAGQPGSPPAKQAETSVSQGAERWPSGRRRTPAKGVRVNALRGFESLSLRQNKPVFYLGAERQNGPYENRTKIVANLKGPRRDRIRLATLWRCREFQSRPLKFITVGLRASAYQPPVSADVRRQASHRRCLAGIAALKNSVVGEVRKTPY